MRTNIPVVGLVGGGAGLLVLVTGANGLDFANFAAAATIVALLGMLTSLVLAGGWASDEAPGKALVAGDPATVHDRRRLTGSAVRPTR